MDKCKYIIAEDTFLLREGLKSILNSYPNVSLQEEGEVDHILENAKHFEEAQLLFVNIDHLSTTNFLKLKHLSKHFTIKLIALSAEDNFSLDKITFTTEISFSESKESVTEKLDSLIKPNIKDSENTNLSDREKNILKHIAQGCTNNEIAEKLFISSHTVMTHRKNITRKLGIKTVSGLTVYALLNNIVHLDELQ